MTTNDPPQPRSGPLLSSVADFLPSNGWKIILISLLGIVGAAAYYFSAPPVYVSQAKLIVRYVVERSAIDQVQNTLPVGQGGDSIIQAEMEILTSWDLAENVAGLPGMDKLVTGSKTPATPQAVATVISGGLGVSAVKGSNVIVVSFKHADPDLARKALEQLVQQYFIKHLEIHRSKEAAKFITDKVEKSRTKLRWAEEELMKLKTEGGIFSLPAAMAALEAELAKARSDRNAITLELAGQRARIATLERLVAQGDGTNSASVGSIWTAPTANAGVEELNVRLRTELATARAQLAAAEAQSEQLKEILATAQKNLSTLTAIMPRIAEKELARDIEAGNFKSMSENLQNAQVDEALDGSRMPNISVVQDAAPAALDLNGRNKMALGIACGSPVVAVAGILLFGLIIKRPPRAPASTEVRDGSSSESEKVDS